MPPANAMINFNAMISSTAMEYQYCIAGTCGIPYALLCIGIPGPSVFSDVLVLQNHQDHQALQVLLLEDVLGLSQIFLVSWSLMLLLVH
jgi:hypothetical protein